MRANDFRQLAGAKRKCSVRGHAPDFGDVTGDSMAHKMGTGSTTNGRDSNAQRRGIKYRRRGRQGRQHHRPPVRHEVRAGPRRRPRPRLHHLRPERRRGAVPQPLRRRRAGDPARQLIAVRLAPDMAFVTAPWIPWGGSLLLAVAMAAPLGACSALRRRLWPGLAHRPSTGATSTRSVPTTRWRWLLITA